MSSGDTAQKLRDLLAKLETSVTPACPVPMGPPQDVERGTHLLLYSFMIWESEPATAAGWLSRLYAEIIDPNELRVALPEEICHWCGDDDGHSRERAARLRACLNDIYRREHEVSLARLGAVSKREVREYLDSLEGVPSFVAARVSLLGFGSHATPLDLRLHRMLGAQGAIDGTGDLIEAERWLERQIRASESEHVALLLEGWRRQGPKRAGDKAGGKTAKRGAGRSSGPQTARARPSKQSTPKRSKKDT